MNITVFQKSDLNKTFNFKLGEIVFYPSEYDNVGFFKSEKMTTDEALKETWFNSQNIDSENWTKNKKFTAHTIEQKRSSMVGDVFEINNRYYVVDIVGFKEINAGTVPEAS